MKKHRSRAAHSVSMSRASTFQHLSLPPSFCQARGCSDALSFSLSPPQWFACSLPIFSALASLAHARRFLLSSLALSFSLPADSLLALSQLSHFSDSARFVNSESRLLPTKIHPHKSSDCCRQRFTISLLLRSSTHNEITRSGVIFLMSCPQRRRNDLASQDPCY